MHMYTQIQLYKKSQETSSLLYRITVQRNVTPFAIRFAASDLGKKNLKLLAAQLKYERTLNSE